MLYGMTYEQYWYGAPVIAKHFRKYYKLRVNERNEELWRQGLYILDALNVALYNNVNLSDKPRQPKQYIKEPIRLFPLSAEEKQAQAEAQRNKIVENLDKWRKAMGVKYGDRNNQSST